MGSIFGGSKSKSTSESYNRNMDLVTGGVRDSLKYVGQGGASLSDLLGGDATGFNRFKNSLGYDWEAGQGVSSIAAKNLSKGLGDSGSTLKALARFQAGLDNSYLDKYITGQTGLAQLGLNVGNLLGNVGQYSKSTSTSSTNNGFGGFLGGMTGAIAASDRRLKYSIKKIKELHDGLGIYSFKYIGSNKETIGTMADEVKRLRPHALGPVINGYMTVDYSLLGDDYGVV